MVGTAKLGRASDVPADGTMTRWLVCRVGSRLCALPIECLVETMRPLPVERMAHAPPFVEGLSIIRGEPVPVVDAGTLFGDPRGQGQRVVTIKAGGRIVALRVGTVVGLRSMPPSASLALPPLLRAANADMIKGIGMLDAELLLFLEAARLYPDIAGDGDLEGAQR